MLPGSKYWYKISKLTGTPIIAVWLNVIFCIAINLIGLGSYSAIAAIFNVCAIALDWSYCIPIISKVLYTKRLIAEGEGQGFTPGPWNLGRFSWYINVWAVVWTFFVSIVFVFPTLLPVTPENMNYAIVILAGISLFAWYASQQCTGNFTNTLRVYWLLGANKRYYGPRVNIHTEDNHDLGEDVNKNKA